MPRRARDVLREIPIKDLLQMVKKAAELYTKAELPLGDGTQTPDQFVAHAVGHDRPARAHVPVQHGEEPLRAVRDGRACSIRLTRGLDLNILSRGYGVEDRGVPVSFQASRRCWAWCCRPTRPACTRSGCRSFRCRSAWSSSRARKNRGRRIAWPTPSSQAGIPKQAIAIYPGLGDVGAAVLQHCPRSLIFGGTATVEQYKGNPRVQAHGPGFSKILLGDDKVDEWEKYIDIMVDSVFVNSGRGCINCSGIWASRHTRKIAEAIAEQMGPVEPLPPEDPEVRPGRVHRAEPGRRHQRPTSIRT